MALYDDNKEATTDEQGLGATPAGAVSLTGDGGTPARSQTEIAQLDAGQAHTADNPGTKMGLTARVANKFQGGVAGEPSNTNPASPTTPSTSKTGGFWDTLKSAMSGGGVSYKVPTDPSALPIPEQTPEGIGHKIMRYALPMAFGMRQGVGVLPGAMAGMADSGDDSTYQKAMKNYTGQQRVLQVAKGKTAFDQNKWNEEKDFKKQQIGIAGGGLALRQAAQAASIPTAQESSAAQKVSPAIRAKLNSMSDQQLVAVTSDPDPTNRAAASYFLKKRKGNKTQSQPLGTYNGPVDENGDPIYWQANSTHHLVLMTRRILIITMAAQKRLKRVCLLPRSLSLRGHLNPTILIISITTMGVQTRSLSR